MKTAMLRALLCCALSSASAVCYGQTTTTTGLLKNQTAGYGAGAVLTFTYTQNFDCVEQPNNDLNYNGVNAKADPGELQTPICTAGFNPTINPPGAPTRTTDPLFVLIPMFSVNNDQNPNDAISCDNVVAGTTCGTTLGNTLISLFGAVPEAFKQTPMVYTQCPNADLPPGTCTMHASRIDLAPVLAALGYIANPPTSNVFVPDPNHSHLLLSTQINQAAEWWQVIPVLVKNKSYWPSKDGTKGITSYAALQSAEQSGAAVQAPSNFFLYFSSQKMSTMNMGAAH
jgi:hypothetical protein